jgi:hypothetical protein
MKPLILSLFDLSTNMVKPWAANHFPCLCVDIQHKQNFAKLGPYIYICNTPIQNFIPPNYPIGIVFAFPPCTNLAVSGAKHFKSKGLRSLIRSIEIATQLKVPYAVENPVSTISTYYRKPDYTFHPYHYGDLYTKKTCLWTSSDFIMPEPIYPSPPEGTDFHRIHHLPPTTDRANKRSVTPKGFAEAVYQANHPYVLFQFQQNMQTLLIDYLATKHG